MSIEIMHINFQIHGTNILGVLQKIAGSLFFLATLYIFVEFPWTNNNTCGEVQKKFTRTSEILKTTSTTDCCSNLQQAYWSLVKEIFKDNWVFCSRGSPRNFSNQPRSAQHQSEGYKRLRTKSYYLHFKWNLHQRNNQETFFSILQSSWIEGYAPNANWSLKQMKMSCFSVKNVPVASQREF